jgi:Icc protein
VLVSLDAALTAAPGHVLIGLHHPPVAICPDPSCRLEPADQVLAVLARHPNVRIVAAGHLHVTDETERGGLTQLLSPSTGIQLRHQHPLRDHNGAPTPIGARLIELDDDGTFTTELRWV